MDERETLLQTLEMAQTVLAVLEKQSAGYTVLTIPPHIQIQLDEKRQEVASLQTRLDQLQGRATDLVDNLQRPPATFVGRKQEITRCLDALSPEERGWGVTIDGIGGIGKTALALEVAQRARQKAWFDAYLFISAKTTWFSALGVRQETLAHTSLDAFVREFMHLLGHTQERQITDALERRRALLDALRGRRALLIWDNLETLTVEERDLIAEFLRKLPAPNKAIITSRYRTGESALTVRLDRLSESEALELMQHSGQRHRRVAQELRRAGKDVQRTLYEVAGGNPLVLEAALGLIAHKGHTLDGVLKRLRDVEQSQEMYAFLFADATRDLVESDRAVLSALSAFHTPASASALADASGLSAGEVSMALERLLTLSLVNDLEGGDYGLHPLTRNYVLYVLRGGEREQQTALDGISLDPAARRKALRYWVDYAKQYGGSHKDAYQTYDRLQAQWPNLEAAAALLYDLSGFPGALQDQEAARMLNDLAKALGFFLNFWGYWDERMRLGQWAYQVAQELQEWSEAGWRAYEVAWIHCLRAETDRAAAWADRITEAMARGGSRRDRAFATRMRGLVANQRGDLDESERFYNQALDAYRELEDEDSQSLALNDLGSVARKRRNYDRAEAYYRQGLALATKVGAKEPQAYISSNLGLLALNRDRLAEALGWFERGLSLAQQVGRQDEIARAQDGLARVLEKEGRYAEALRLAQAALQIYERLGNQNLEVTRKLVERLREKVGE